MTRNVVSSETRAWWKEAVVYQIYPWSFNDSDGDGVGDLAGIIEKLDYLDELGVDVVWLNPVYDSPQVDNGYDISNYRAIHDQFGSIEEWQSLLDGLHAREMRLIMDLAVNHTSDEHDWFRKSEANPDGEYGDYYLWHPGRRTVRAEASPGPADRAPPNNWESHFGGPAWAWSDVREEYYLHLYHERQPDLNWANPAVRAEIHDLMRFWLEKGIDGFRLDVINVISKPESYPDGDPRSGWIGREHFVNGPHVMDYLQELHDEVFAEYDAMTVGEMPDVTVEQARAYTGEDGPLDMVFNFDHMRLDFGETGRWAIGDWSLPELKAVLSEWQTGVDGSVWPSMFFENHDQPRIVSRFGDDEQFHYESATLLGTILLTLRGTPFVYQGQELGMTNCEFESLDELRDVDTINNVRMLMDERGVSDYSEIRDLVEHRARDNSRTPMQWDSSEHAGFTTGEPWLPVNPNHRELNVADERARPNSVLSYYESLIDLRDESETLVYGEYELLLPDHESVFAFTRTLGDDQLLVVCNFDEGYTSVRIPGLDPASELLLANYDDVPHQSPLDLRPFEARIYRRT
ncbi:glycoside hydrolase family 13 protein [Natronomonas sp. EA1]|uniref:glycoside hydrolase family 13 protein n=1 Tax=Natronomonas sp. EA1 TaxID=3421655 RepID=UPI003EBC7720